VHRKNQENSENAKRMDYVKIQTENKKLEVMLRESKSKLQVLEN
jgi:hypothetical protein